MTNVHFIIVQVVQTKSYRRTFYSRTNVQTKSYIQTTNVYFIIVQVVQTYKQSRTNVTDVQRKSYKRTFYNLTSRTKKVVQNSFFNLFHLFQLTSRGCPFA